MEIRWSVWGIVLLGLVAAGSVFLWPGEEPGPPRAPAPGWASPTTARSAAGERVASASIGDANAKAGAARGRYEATRAQGGVSTFARGEQASGAQGRLAAARAGHPRGARPRTKAERVDRELERQVARFAQDLDLPTLPRSRASREEGLTDADYVSDVADAAMVEYLLRAELWDLFHSRNQLVPFGYPLNPLRDALAAEVAGLSPGDRNALLALVEETMPDQKPPLMSKKIEYEGPDFEGQPTGVDFYE